MQVFSLFIIYKTKAITNTQNMKKTFYLLALGLLATAFTLTSCLNNDCDDPYLAVCPIDRPNALVTVKPNADNTAFWMQLTDDIVLWPVNMRQSPFGTKEVRALLNYRMPTKEELEKGGIFGGISCVYVNWIDSILTKPVVVNFASDEENRQKYGSDPLEIVDDWVTVAEDGYLTLRIRTRLGGHQKHIVNLVHRTDVNTPYYFTLYHNAQGDTNGQMGDALVAFNISTELTKLDTVLNPGDDAPEGNGNVDTLTLEWQSYTGTKTARFKFRSGNASPEKLEGLVNRCFE